MAEKKLRPGQKIKMVSVDELLGVAGEESSYSPYLPLNAPALYIF